MEFAKIAATEFVRCINAPGFKFPFPMEPVDEASLLAATFDDVLSRALKDGYPLRKEDLVRFLLKKHNVPVETAELKRFMLTMDDEDWNESRDADVSGPSVDAVLRNVLDRLEPWDDGDPDEGNVALIAAFISDAEVGEKLYLARSDLSVVEPEDEDDIFTVVLERLD